MRISRLVAAAGLFAVLGLAASAQDPKEQPKEQPKVVLPPDVIPSPFRMYLATDRRFEPLKDAAIAAYSAVAEKVTELVGDGGEDG